ncbi:uncharacterized protein METZ01_LOCUS445810, partial [marine metagenome]
MVVPQEVRSPQELCFQGVSAILEEMAGRRGNVSVSGLWAVFRSCKKVKRRFFLW